MRYSTHFPRLALILLTLFLALTPAMQPVAAQEASASAPAAAPLALDADGAAQATGVLVPQGMARYSVNLTEGAFVQAAITPADTDLILTVVGADGNPLLTDHAGASKFEETMLVTQAYTFTVINFGDARQAYTFDLTVSAAEPVPVSVRVPLADALGMLEPQAVWQHFYDLTQVPRPSHHEEQATAFVAAYGERLGLETSVDAVGNVIIRKPATPGMEDRPGVILQAHLDMVPQKTPDSTHDFLTDPIDAYIEDGWVHADRTTLGADDGSGVAIIMALLADEELVHPSLEALFTTNEEDGFTGINGLAPDVLQGQYYINIDNEVEGQFLISSAGGVYADVAAAYAEEATPDGMTGLEVTLDGLRGGHSGADIDKGRGSAHQLMARLLWNAPAELGVRLESLVGGNQANAIPRTTTATVAVPEEQVDAFTAYVAEFAATIQHELLVTEPDLTVNVAPADVPALVMATDAQQSLIGAVYGAPQGIIRMSDSVPGLVETSGNIGVLNIADGVLDAVIYVRSAVDSARDDAAARFRSVFELGGATVTLHDAYSGWPPNPDSPLLALMTQTYQDLFDVAPAAVAIHAGLETSVAGVTYPGLDMISIGPTLLNVHSPDERWEVASTPRVYELLVATLAALR
jgi:dipeptidase D